MITEKDIESIAKLSSLEVREEEIPKIQSDMEHILDFAQTVCSCDFCDSVKFTDEASTCILREDKAEKSYPSSEMLLNAPVHKDGYILLRKSE